MKLVILTTHFGTNFSGGSKATCELFVLIQRKFESVTVIGTELGEHPFENLNFIPFERMSEAVSIVRKMSKSNVIFYSDFYVAYAYVLADVGFYFTYHDNWPEVLATEPPQSGCRWRWRAYQSIFRNARHVFTVSEFKRREVAKYSGNVSLVRNGISQDAFLSTDNPSSPVDSNRQDIVMVGTIDQRKYGLAPEVLRKLSDFLGVEYPGLKVDIYGHVGDPVLAASLDSIPCVKLQGFKSTIPYKNYRLCLHTSSMENLSLVWCEALHSNTPVVAFDVGGAAEVISCDRGVLVPAFDSDGMCQAVIRCLSRPPVFDGSSLRSCYSWEKASLAVWGQLINDH